MCYQQTLIDEESVSRHLLELPVRKVGLAVGNELTDVVLPTHLKNKHKRLKQWCHTEGRGNILSDFDTTSLWAGWNAAGFGCRDKRSRSCSRGCGSSNTFRSERPTAESETAWKTKRAELQRLPAGSVQLHLCALPAPHSSCQLHLGRTMKSQGGQTVWVWPKICEQACCMIEHQEVLLQTPRDGGLSLVLYPAGSSTDAAS